MPADVTQTIRGAAKRSGPSECRIKLDTRKETAKTANQSRRFAFDPLVAPIGIEETCINPLCRVQNGKSDVIFIWFFTLHAPG